MPRTPRARPAPTAARRRHAWVTLLAFAALLGACGPTGPGTESFAGLRLSIGAATPHTPAPLTITAIGNRGSDPLPGYAGSVTLEVDAGAIDTTSVALADGRATRDVVFTGLVGPVTLTASAGGVAATVLVDLQPLTAIPGDANDSASDALPYLAYVPRADEYADDAPDLPGLPMSVGTILATIDPSATVADLDALLARHDAGLAGMVPDPSGTVGPLVALRLPSTNHADLLPLLTALAAEPLVRSAHRDLQAPDPDPQGAEPATSGIGRAELPQPRDGAPAGWTWELDSVTPQPSPDANWGLEAIRMPQAWNLNAAIADAPDLPTGVLDGGFVPHPDLDLTILGPAAAPEDAAHGLHVAGTIGARFDDAGGVDGVNPVAGLVARRYTAGSMAWGMVDLIQARPDLRVVNASIGMKWHVARRNPNEDANAQAQMNASGQAFADVLAARRANGLPTPIIVATAGNSSGQPELGFAVLDARWNSTFANAALAQGAPGIVIVEAVQRALNDARLLVRAGFSNVGGHVSAPGVDIVSTVPGGYALNSGTSMAAPHVTGLLGLMLAHAGDDLTPDQVIAALLLTARPTASANTARVIDSFGALLALDGPLGQPFLLRRLADTDDGTPDGNLRMDPFTGDAVDTDTLALRGLADFGLAGDGFVDMRDFRRFRDALLAAEDAPDLALDGDPLHDKRDLNRDGQVQNATLENVFPRFDLNGDGIVHRTATHPVGGLMLDAPATDLQVLQFVWQDPDVDAADLPDLLDSGDVHLDAEGALGAVEAAAVEIEFLGPTPRTVRLTPGTPTAVVTLAVGAYDVEVRYLDPQDALLIDALTTAVVELGGDVGLELEDPMAPGWVQQFGTVDEDQAWGVATGADGRVAIAGWTNGGLEGTDLQGVDAFLRVLAPDGATLWTRQFGTAGGDYAYAVAIDPSGRIAVAGSTSGDLVSGQDEMRFRGFLRSYEADGTERWTRQFGDAIGAYALTVATDADGRVAVAGEVFTVDDRLDAFVHVYDANGAELWSSSFGTPGFDEIRAVSFGPNGVVAVAGSVGEPLPNASPAVGTGAFVRLYDAQGVVLWTRGFDSDVCDVGWGVAVAGDGRTYLSGSVCDGNDDAFVAAFEADGAGRWTHVFGSPFQEVGVRVATGRDGSVTVAGTTTGDVVPGAGAFDDAFVRRLDAGGAVIWTRQVGTEDSDTLRDLAVARDGGVLIVGTTFGAFAGSSNAGGRDAFVLRVVP